MSKLLLFSLVLFSAGSLCFAATAVDTAVKPGGSEAAIYKAMSEAPANFDRVQIDSGQGGDHVCLNIHAFIFKTDDDRIPKLVGETTCMPAARVGAKKVNGNVRPKLIPATGGNSF